MKLLIGLVGRKRTGKDTVAKFVDEMSEGMSVMSFADPLKMACKHAYCLSESQLEQTKDVIDSRWGMTPRDMMKSLGVKYFRSQDPDHWIKNMVFRLQGLDNVIISDARFHNEAMFIKRHGGVLVHVSRDLESNEDNHVSERTTDDIVCDYFIRNDGSLDDLREKVLALMRSLK